MFLDIGVGILLAIVTSKFFAFPLTLNWILLGMGFALVPDIDVFYELVRRRGKLAGKTLGGHREWTHYPLLYIPATAAVWLYWGNEVGSLFFLGALWHFVHDSHGTGWGLVLLGPFDRRRNFKFFSNKDGTFNWHSFLMSWDREELTRIVQEHGNDNWVRDIYLRPSFTFLIELLGLVIALLVLYWVK